jgi:AcrR family transcriptional regulator
MGLRERNAARTRRAIYLAAMDSFAEHGYEDTTMEEIAQRAEIGSSTLYRYFPNKEAVILEPLGEPGVMAAELAERPAGEETAVLVGSAVLALIEHAEAAFAVDPRLDGVIQENVKAAIHLLAWYRNDERLLEEALYERTGAAPGDLTIAFTAKLAGVILDLTVRARNAAEEPLSPVETARQLMGQLYQTPPTMPHTP